MTRSTGKMDKQRRREDLFRAEIRLHRTMLHLGNAYGYAKRAADQVEIGAVLDAIWIVQRIWMAVLDEESELCR